MKILLATLVTLVTWVESFKRYTRGSGRVVGSSKSEKSMETTCLGSYTCHLKTLGNHKVLQIEIS